MARKAAMVLAIAGVIIGVPDLELVAQESRSGALEEIIVTATRRETALQDTALSVTALSEAQLQSMGARDIVDYFEHVAGLNYTDDSFGGFRISSRGIAAGTFVETRPLSAFYLDETPMMAIASGSGVSPQWGGTRPQAVDVARVEILRGPQGTLFGASTIGSAVRMITNAPEPEEFFGSVEAGLSTTMHGGDNYKINGVLNAPLVKDRLALRLVGYLRDDAGFIRNVARNIEDINDVRTAGARLAVLWDATTNLAMTARAQRQERKTGGLSASDIAVGDYEQARYVEERNDEVWDLFTLEIDYSLPWVQLKSINSRLEREPTLGIDITDFLNGALGIFNPTTNEILDSIDDSIHELRLTSVANGSVSWVAGAYYQKQDRAWFQRWLSPGFDALTGGLAASFGYPDTLFLTRVTGALRQQAIYADVSYRLAPSWEATLGARWFEFEYAIDNTTDGLAAGGPSQIQASSEESGVTPKLGLAFRPNDAVLLFANAAQGFRPGGTNEFRQQTVDNCADTLESLGVPVPPPRGFESDSLWNFELGTKANLLDKRLAINATVYHVRWEDMQTTRTVDCTIDLINIIENVGKVTADGFELEIAWSPIDSLQISIGTAYTDSRLEEDAPNIAGEAGERIPTVPEWTFNASAITQFTLTARTEGFARAGYTYVDSSWSDFDATIRRRTPSRQVLDLRFGVQFDDWRVELFADNVFDERAVLLHSNNVVGESEVLMRPRTVGLELRFAF